MTEVTKGQQIYIEYNGHREKKHEISENDFFYIFFPQNLKNK